MPSNSKVVEGDITFNDSSILNYTTKEWESIRGTKLSMVFQDTSIMMNSVRTIGKQFVDYIITHKKYKKDEAWELGKKTLESVGLIDSENIMKSYINQLSGGMQQRVGIAFAIFFKPELLLADEPTSALDVTSQAYILKEIENLRNVYGTSIIFITHDLAIALSIADYVIVLKNGKILEQNEPKSILENPKFEYTKELISAMPTLD